MDSTRMTCQELVELVTAYQEGTLSAEERARFEDHLTMCPPCVTYVEQMALTARATGGLSDDLVSATSTRQLLDLFREWKRERS